MIESSRNRVFTAAIIVMLAICLFLYFIRGIPAPFAMAAFITYLISPIVVEIQCYGYRRWVGVAVIAFAFISVFAVFFVKVVPVFIIEVGKSTSAASDYYISFSNYIDIIGSKIETVIPIVKRYDILSAVVKNQIFYVFRCVADPSVSYECSFYFFNYNFNSDACYIYAS
ncbi:MAG: hypothetical protein LBS81_02215 [Endomicrobium sp.]|nr:hypothetical protein [Endomicrobium sp.]